MGWIWKFRSFHLRCVCFGRVETGSAASSCSIFGCFTDGEGMEGAFSQYCLRGRILGIV